MIPRIIFFNLLVELSTFWLAVSISTSFNVLTGFFSVVDIPLSSPVIFESEFLKKFVIIIPEACVILLFILQEEFVFVEMTDRLRLFLTFKNSLELFGTSPSFL